ncbi:MAG: hypothetical protein IPK52_26965 [Chloroflexi bacterium]|nr:hypothetical protein [Chloroflexota bacterium]
MDANEVIRDLRNLEDELRVLQTTDQRPPGGADQPDDLHGNSTPPETLLGRDVEGEDKRILAHGLFEKSVYDMDAKQITDFTAMKASAEPFLIYRAEELLERFRGRRNEKPPRLGGPISNPCTVF